MGIFEEKRLYRAAHTLTTLFILAIIYVPICLIAKLKHYLLCQGTRVEKKNQTIVITGAKMYKSTLFVKWLGKAGYDIVLVETEKFWCSGSRFSKYVKKFYTVADAITKPEQYVKDMVKICKENNANMFIPACAPATEKLDSIVGQQLEQFGVKVLHAPIDIFEKLNDKHQFCELMKELGLAVPESFLVTSNEEVFQVNEELKQRIKRDGEKYRYKHVFILKNIDYDPVHRLDLFQLPANDKDIHEYLEKIKRDGNPITQKHPWSIQRFIDGDMWAACQIQVAGQVCLYTCTHSTASCFNWDHKKNDQIRDWMDKFAKNLNVDGIFTNDFIVDRNDGVAYAIECNPRLGSQVSLFHQNKHMADIITGDHWDKQIEPATQQATYTAMNEIFVLLDPSYYADEELNQNVSLPYRIVNFIKNVSNGCDPIFDPEDMLPFYMINFFQMPVLLFDTAVNNRPWKKIDFQIGKVVELGGY